MENQESWLTLSEIARRLGRGESSVRAWRNRFGAYLVYRQPSKGPRLWRCSQFELIDAMLGRGHSKVEIQRALSGDAAPEDLRPEEDILQIRRAVLEALANVLNAQERQIETLERIERLLEQMRDRTI